MMMFRSTTNFASLETTAGDGVKIGITNMGGKVRGLTNNSVPLLTTATRCWDEGSGHSLKECPKKNRLKNSGTTFYFFSLTDFAK